MVDFYSNGFRPEAVYTTRTEKNKRERDGNKIKTRI